VLRGLCARPEAGMGINCSFLQLPVAAGKGYRTRHARPDSAAAAVLYQRLQAPLMLTSFVHRSLPM
jgi:hypothetical protein